MYCARAIQRCASVTLRLRAACNMKVCERADEPETGVDLMSQPTFSRVENTPDAMAL